MMALIIAVVGIVFLFGLVQWARSGALLWDIYEILKGSRLAPSGSGAFRSGRSAGDANKEAEKSIQRMETSMDRLLRSSIKILGGVAVCVWLFLAFSFVADMFGFHWMDRLTSTSSHRIVGSPAARSGGGARTAPRSTSSERLHEMGSRFRR